MGIRRGTSAPSRIFRGAAAVRRVYRGEGLRWPWPTRAHLAALTTVPNGAWQALGSWVTDDGMAPTASTVWTSPDAATIIASLRMDRQTVGTASRPNVQLKRNGTVVLPPSAATSSLATGDGIAAAVTVAPGDLLVWEARGTGFLAQDRTMTTSCRARMALRDRYGFGSPAQSDDFSAVAPDANLGVPWVDHMYSTGVVKGGGRYCAYPSGAGNYRSFNCCYYNLGLSSQDMWVRAVILSDLQPSASGYGGPSVVARHNGTAGVFGRVTADTWTIMRGSSNTTTTADSALASGSIAAAPTVGDVLDMSVQGSTATLRLNGQVIGVYTGSLGAGSFAGFGFNRDGAGLLGLWEAGTL